MGFTDTIKGVFGFKSKAFTETTARPSIAQPYFSTDTGAKLPIFPFPLIMIYELADNIDAIRIPIETLNRELFKNGFEVVERFKYKCQECSKEFDYKPIKVEEEQETSELTTKANDNMECDTCGSVDIVRPEPRNRKILEKLIHDPVNGNGQTIEDVARMLERDLEIADNAYMLLLKTPR